VIKAVFDADRDISIDAALIRIDPLDRFPKDGSFTAVSKGKLEQSGKVKFGFVVVVFIIIIIYLFITLPEHLISPLVFIEVHVVLSFVSPYFTF